MRRYINSKKQFLFLRSLFIIIMLISSASAVEKIPYTLDEHPIILIDGWYFVNSYVGTASGGLRRIPDPTPNEPKDPTHDRTYQYSPTAHLTGTDAPDRVRVEYNFIYIESWKGGVVDKDGHPNDGDAIPGEVEQPLEQPNEKTIIKKVPGHWKKSKDTGIGVGKVNCGEISEISIDLKGGDDVALELPLCDGAPHKIYTGERSLGDERNPMGEPIMQSVEGDKATFVNGGEDDDIILTGSGTPHKVKGMEGDDSIYMRGLKINTVSGGDGHDTIYGSWPYDSETYVCGGKGEDVITAIDGKNTFRGADDTDIIKIKEVGDKKHPINLVKQYSSGGYNRKIEISLNGKPKGEGQGDGEEWGEDRMECSGESVKCDPNTLPDPITFEDIDLAADCPEKEEEDPTPPPEPPISHGQ